VALVAMSPITRDELSVSKIILLGVHLWVDLATVILLADSLSLFRFAHLIWWVQLPVGLMEIVVSLITNHRPRHAV
jgi:hypothetical protein